MNKIIIIILIIFSILAAYFIIQKQTDMDLQVLNTPQEETIKNSSEIFDGTMPCADCSGLKTILTLNKDSLYSAEGSYILSETYIGKSKTPNITQGEWTTIKGTPDDPKAIIYQLTAPNNGQPINYLLVNSNTLELVDQNFNTIDSPFNLTLTLTK